MLEMLRPTSPEQIEEVRRLFLEYEKSSGVSLCFQNFEQEVKDLPGAYKEPSGTLLIASQDGIVAGCCALRPFTQPSHQNAAEMKRLYVRPMFRGAGIAGKLVERIIREAKQKEYSSILLDTLPSMTASQELYQQLGFVEIAPYYPNPIAGAKYLRLDLLMTKPTA